MGFWGSVLQIVDLKDRAITSPIICIFGWLSLIQVLQYIYSKYETK
jgi:hypothetical protein